MKHWSEPTSFEKQKRIAWEIAASTALETRDDAVIIYERIMRDWESKHKSSESQISGMS